MCGQQPNLTAGALKSDDGSGASEAESVPVAQRRHSLRCVAVLRSRDKMLFTPSLQQDTGLAFLQTRSVCASERWTENVVCVVLGCVGRPRVNFGATFVSDINGNHNMQDGYGRRPASRIQRRDPTPALAAALGGSGIAHCIQYDAGGPTIHPLGKPRLPAPPTELELGSGGGRRHFEASPKKASAARVRRTSRAIAQGRCRVRW